MASKIMSNEKNLSECPTLMMVEDNKAPHLSIVPYLGKVLIWANLGVKAAMN